MGGGGWVGGWGQTEGAKGRGWRASQSSFAVQIPSPFQMGTHPQVWVEGVHGTHELERSHSYSTAHLHILQPFNSATKRLVPRESLYHLEPFLVLRGRPLAHLPLQAEECPVGKPGAEVECLGCHLAGTRTAVD